jgi:hypothetical protein
VNVDVSTWFPHGFPTVNDTKLSVLVISCWLKLVEFVIIRMNFCRIKFGNFFVRIPRKA